MIIRNLRDVSGSDREVKAQNGNWASRRLLLKDDDMGFSMHDTVIKAGSETPIWYKNHMEAVYCIAGDGRLEDLDSGLTHRIEPGVLYALDGHDRHILRGGSEDMRLVCVFSPALKGDEVHDEDGSYPADE